MTPENPVLLHHTIRIETTGHVFWPVVERTCGHEFAGCRWNDEHAARRHGVDLAKHVCGVCRGPRKASR